VFITAQQHEAVGLIHIELVLSNSVAVCYHVACVREQQFHRILLSVHITHKKSLVDAQRTQTLLTAAAAVGVHTACNSVHTTKLHAISDNCRC
jgi:hypothetical protein